MCEKPKTIFRYEKFNTQSLLNLKSQIIYFASPCQFNDPYDCAITASIADPLPEEVARIRDFLLNNNSFSFSNEIKGHINTIPLDKMTTGVLGGLTQAVANVRDKFSRKNGVCCFAERNDNLLMWSHYGDSCKGFCLEFRTEYEPFTKLRKVRYVSEMPTIAPSPLIIDDDCGQLIDLFCTKSEDWSYEQEWRAIHEKDGTLFGYKSQALKAVYFGPKIERQALEIICLILRGQNPDVELWQGHRSETKFKVEFERFTYTPHIETKKNTG